MLSWSWKAGLRCRRGGREGESENTSQMLRWKGGQPTSENGVGVPLLYQVVNHSVAGTWISHGPGKKARWTG